MLVKIFCFCIVFVVTTTSCISQSTETREYTDNQKNSITIFTEFTKYLRNSIHDKIDITDTFQLKYQLLNFLFANTKLDSSNKKLSISELNESQLTALRYELKLFYRFLQETKNKSLIENITVMPAEKYKDKFIYNRLTDFQKQNTFIFYDKRFPDRILGYLLIIPPINNIISAPRIWSWTLIYKFGKFVFRSITGEEGQEYLFEEKL